MASFPLRSLSSLKVAAGDMLLERRRPQPAPDDASSADLYLAPHFDDICFSLGAYVRRRRRGILLTLFSISRYVARPDELQIKASERTAAISALRLAEDLAFARQVGLRQLTAGLDEAPVRGREPFDTDKAAADAILLDRQVIDAIFAAAPERAAGPRPWLYCPMGIGGHVDHVAVLTIVLKHYEALRASYRIAFYEDLHYASAWTLRVAGLDAARRRPATLSGARRALEASALAPRHRRSPRQARPRFALSEPVRRAAALHCTVHAGAVLRGLGPRSHVDPEGALSRRCERAVSAGRRSGALNAR